MATATRLLRMRLVAANNRILWSSTLKSNRSLWESSSPLAQRLRSLPRANITTEASPFSCVKEQFSATKEEVKGASGFGKKGSSGSYDQQKATSGEEMCHQSGSNGSAAATLLDMVKATVSYASPKVSMAFQKLKEVKVKDFAKKGYEIVKDELNGKPSKKRHLEYSYYPSMGERSTRTDIAVVARNQSPWSKKLDDIKEKIRSHPIYKRVKGVSDPVVVKSQEIAEDMLERWETSDSPIVHKIQDLNERIFVETDAAATSKEIRQRDPSFSLPEFVAEVEEVVRPVLNAWMKGDYKTLEKYCSPEVIQRHKAEQAAFRSHGIFFDNKILHISEVDVKETRMMGTSPIIIVSFQTQQVHCVRDKNGAITEGGKDTIHSVYYVWAMQQVDPEELGEDAINPIWRIRDMQKMGVQALI